MMTFEQDTENIRPDPVEEAGETTAAASIPTPTDTRPVGEGTTVVVEGEGGEHRGKINRPSDSKQEN
jgi:hypothetical protein